MIKMGLGSHQMYNNNIIKFQEPTIILNASTKKVWKLIEAPGIPQILKTEIQAWPSYLGLLLDCMITSSWFGVAANKTMFRVSAY